MDGAGAAETAGGTLPGADGLEAPRRLIGEPRIELENERCKLCGQAATYGVVKIDRERTEYRVSCYCSTCSPFSQALERKGE